MSKILELREKRAKAWEAAKAFLDAKRTQEGFVSAEDAATYDKMEADVVNLGRQQAPRSQTSRMLGPAGRQKQEGQPMNIRERSGTV